MNFKNSQSKNIKLEIIETTTTKPCLKSTNQMANYQTLQEVNYCRLRVTEASLSAWIFPRLSTEMPASQEIQIYANQDSWLLYNQDLLTSIDYANILRILLPLDMRGKSLAETRFSKEHMVEGLSKGKWKCSIPNTEACDALD